MENMLLLSENPEKDRADSLKEKLEKTESEMRINRIEAMNITHDFKNRAQSALSELEFLKMDHPELKEPVSSILRSVSEAVDIIKSYDLYIRGETLTGNSELYKCVHQIFRNLKPFAGGIKLEERLWNKEANLNIHPSYLRRILLNIGKNSYEAIRKDSGKEDLSDFYFRVSASPQEDMALIYCDDNGPGIPTENWRIVENYSTKGNGRGQGLSSVKSLVERASGKIWIGSNEDNGTRISLLIPLTKSYHQ